MSVNYPVSLRNTRLQDVATSIDAAGGNGWLRLLVSGTVISSLQLARPCASVAGGVLIFGGMPLVDPAASAGGTPNLARIEDSAGNIIISGLTVGGSTGYDVILTSSNPVPYSIVAGQTVAITTATITGA